MTEKCQWQEAVLTDGRRYYFNPSTGESTWEKPVTYIPHGSNAPISNIMSASAIIKQHMSNASGTTATTSNTDIAASWREMTNATGKKYYYNTLTKVSVWEMPAEYREYLSRQRDPALVSKEKGESLFHKMLKEHGITSKWSWEETLREVINDPKYKCLPTLAERKASFASFIEKQKQVEIEEEEQKRKDAHENFLKMLKSAERKHLLNGHVRFKEAQEIFNRDKRWNQVEDEKERQFIFERFIDELRRSKALELQEKRKIGTWKFIQLLREEPDLNDLEVQWKEALIIFSSMKEFKEDSDIQSLQPIDLLTLFEDHIKRLEYLRDRKRQKIQIQKEMDRMEAQNSFSLLLDRLVKDGSFTAMTCWPELFTIIKEERAFLNLLPTVPGTSGPLDLYWDKLDELQKIYLPHRQIIYSKLESVFGEKEGWSIKDLEQMTLPGKLDDFITPDAIVDEESLKYKFLILRELHKIHGEILKRQTQKRLEDVDMNSLKQQYRLSIDRYKKILKNLGHINLSSSFLDYKAKLESEDLRDLPEILKIVYFEKYIAHLKRKFGGGVEGGNNGTGIIDHDINQSERGDSVDEREEGEVISSNISDDRWKRKKY